MQPSEGVSPVSESARDRALSVNFAWLTRLRLGAVLGQLIVIFGVQLALGVHLPLLALGSVLALELGLCAWAYAHARRGRAVREGHVTLSVGADLLLFSALLYFTGGPANPFSFLYLIHIALAAVVLPPRKSFALVALALLCSLSLFFFSVPLALEPAHAHHHDYGWHLRGMWVAFGVAACFIVYFIQRMLREVALIESRLESSRRRAAKSEQLAALVMLSAGAAHELSSPLTTIAVASGELLRSLPPEAAVARDDVKLIRAQIERCRGILDQLSADAGQARGSAATLLRVDELVAHALRGTDTARLDVEALETSSGVFGPLGALAQALRNLLQNALDANPARRVRLRFVLGASEIGFEVKDNGPGMTAEVRARATEPFFTTKSRGQGMGLGLFLTESVAQQVGGRLELWSESGRGTTATLVLPLARAPRPQEAT